MDGELSIEDKQDLVLLYHSGELEKSEAQRVEKWLELDDALQVFSSDHLNQSALLQDGAREEENVELDLVDKVIQLSQDKPSKSGRWGLLLSVAAAVVLLPAIIIGFSMGGTNSERQLVEQPSPQKTQPVVSSKPSLNRFKKVTKSVFQAEPRVSRVSRISKRQSQKSLERWRKNRRNSNT